MGEELGFSNILGERDIDSLFSDYADSSDDVEGQETNSEEGTDDKNPHEQEHITTEVANPDDLFEDDQPESVGSEEDKSVKEDTVPEKDDGTSPNNLYSSIANALLEDGIFPNQTDEAVNKVDSAESLAELFEAEIAARVDERTQRVYKALNNGVEPSDIKKYEDTIDYINSITDKDITAETEAGETLRKNLIYQDFLNRGMSPEKARKLTDRSVDAGTDVEDAKEALQSNKEYFQSAYTRLREEAQEKADKAKADLQKQADSIKTSIMKDKQLFGDIEVSGDVRRKIVDNISRPVYKDPETGNYLTAIQKYEMEHRAEFIKNVGIIFTLTNGFKDFDSFTKGKVNKEMKKGLRELEKKLNSTSRNSDGSLRLVTNSRREDPDSYFGTDFKLALN